MDAVKIEGGGPSRVAAAKAIVDAGVAVMGHVGLTPQSISTLGGFRPQGRSASGAIQVYFSFHFPFLQWPYFNVVFSTFPFEIKVVEHALALQEAGCFALVVECTPPPVSAAVSAALDIPTIGIGAGPHCSGQVLVYHDLLGMMQHPHHAKVLLWLLLFSVSFLELKFVILLFYFSAFEPGDSQVLQAIC